MLKKKMDKKYKKNLQKAVVVIKHFVYILLIYEEQYDFFLPFLIQFSLIRQTIPPSSYMEVLPGTTRCQLPYKFHQKCIYQDYQKYSQDKKYMDNISTIIYKFIKLLYVFNLHVHSFKRNVKCQKICQGIIKQNNL